MFFKKKIYTFKFHLFSIEHTKQQMFMLFKTDVKFNLTKILCTWEYACNFLKYFIITKINLPWSSSVIRFQFKDFYLLNQTPSHAWLHMTTCLSLNLRSTPYKSHHKGRRKACNDHTQIIFLRTRPLYISNFKMSY